MAINNKIITVWGSQHCGKTTFSVKLAQALYDKCRATVIVLFCDITTPALPVLFPNRKENELYSVGNVLSRTDIFANDVVSNLVIPKDRMNLGFLGYKNRENRFSFPEYHPQKAEDLLRALSELADYIIVDCESIVQNSILNECAMKQARTMFRLITPDLSCMSFYQSQNSILSAGGYSPARQITVMNIPSNDLLMLSGTTGTHFGKIDITLPFSQMLRNQYLEGTLMTSTNDKMYMQAVYTAVEKIR